jgi:hypothetical protein
LRHYKKLGVRFDEIGKRRHLGENQSPGCLCVFEIPGFRPRRNDDEIHFQSAYETIKDGQSSLAGALIGGYRCPNLVPSLLPAEAFESGKGFNIFPNPARPDPRMLPGRFLKFLGNLSARPFLMIS